MFDLHGKVTVVTGGGSGIGLATAHRFAAAGARVVVVDRDDAGPVSAAAGAEFRRADVRDAGAMSSIIDATAEQHGRIDAVVNCAGVFVEGAIDDTSDEAMLGSYEVNALGVLHGMRGAAAHMEAGASIVNVASLAGVVGFPGYVAYGAAKAAVISMTRVAALEYGPRGIRVNCICPGSVDTPMLAQQPSGDVEAKVVSVAAPLGRIVRPEEVAALAHFLVCEDCATLTGLAIPIDGGVSAGMSTALIDAVVSTFGREAEPHMDAGVR